MKTFVQTGSILTLTAPTGGVTGGLPAKVGSIVAVPVNSALEGEPFEGQVDGVHNLVKATGSAWAEGDAIYWDNTAKACTKTATSNTKIGVAVAAADSADVEGLVRLNAAF
jgi:predicted RecA/RadA family phage recombinase